MTAPPSPGMQAHPSRPGEARYARHYCSHLLGGGSEKWIFLNWNPNQYWPLVAGEEKFRFGGTKSILKNPFLRRSPSTTEMTPTDDVDVDDRAKKTDLMDTRLGGIPGGSLSDSPVCVASVLASSSHLGPLISPTWPHNDNNARKHTQTNCLGLAE